MFKLPTIRASIFDLDGLLINTEELYFHCMSNILSRYNRPPMPRSMKAKLMGVPSVAAADIFYAWAQLPISREQFDAERIEETKKHYPDCEILPGVKKLYNRFYCLCVIT